MDIKSFTQRRPVFAKAGRELEGVLSVPSRPIVTTSSVDVYRGVWGSPRGEQVEVAVKQFKALIPRNMHSDPQALRKILDTRIEREIIIWSQTTHPNLHPFLGYRLGRQPRLISPWCRHGNLTDYLQANPDLSRVDRIRLIYQAALGLDHLHSLTPAICHADIKPENVLINDSGEAALSEFGLSRILQEHGEPSGLTTSENLTGTSRYMAPERFGEEMPSPNRESDVYAFGGLILAVMSGKPPFGHLREAKILLRIVLGQTPKPEEHPNLPPDDILWNLVLRCWDIDPTARPTMREVLWELWDCGGRDAHSGIEGQRYPDDDIGRFITSVSLQPICINGRFGDVFKGHHITKGEVALKRLRIGGTDIDETFIRRFEREARTWRRLKHPYVLEFLGTYKPEAHIYFVSPFAKNGTLLEYISSCPGVNRVRMLCQTSNAVDYLHRENLVHGDIKGSNLLISDDGHVLICDFGLTKSTYAQTSSALKGAGTVRWQSPELWENEPKTFASDVYAFAMTIVEVLTGLPPFSHLKLETAVIKAVLLRDERPPKMPLEFNAISYENAWMVAEACWPTTPGARIPMSEAFRLLKADPSLA